MPTTLIESNFRMDGDVPVVRVVLENLGQFNRWNPAAAEIVVLEAHLFGQMEIVERYPSKREWYESHLPEGRRRWPAGGGAG